MSNSDQLVELEVENDDMYDIYGKEFAFSGNRNSREDCAQLVTDIIGGDYDWGDRAEFSQLIPSTRFFRYLYETEDWKRILRNASTERRIKLVEQGFLAEGFIDKCGRNAILLAAFEADIEMLSFYWNLPDNLTAPLLEDSFPSASASSPASMKCSWNCWTWGLLSVDKDKFVQWAHERICSSPVQHPSDEEETPSLNAWQQHLLPSLRQKNEHQLTPLHLACVLGEKKLLLQLVDICLKQDEVSKLANTNTHAHTDTNTDADRLLAQWDDKVSPQISLMTAAAVSDNAELLSWLDGLHCPLEVDSETYDKNRNSGDISPFPIISESGFVAQAAEFAFLPLGRVPKEVELYRHDNMVLNPSHTHCAHTICNAAIPMDSFKSQNNKAHSHSSQFPAAKACSLSLDVSLHSSAPVRLGLLLLSESQLQTVHPNSRAPFDLIAGCPSVSLCSVNGEVIQSDGREDSPVEITKLRGLKSVEDFTLTVRDGDVIIESGAIRQVLTTLDYFAPFVSQRISPNERCWLVPWFCLAPQQRLEIVPVPAAAGAEMHPIWQRLYPPGWQHVSSDPLHRAAYQDCESSLGALISADRSRVLRKDLQGNTLLHACCRSGSQLTLIVVEAALKIQPLPLRQGLFRGNLQGGRTPLMLAVLSDSLTCLLLLIEKMETPWTDYDDALNSVCHLLSWMPMFTAHPSAIARVLDAIPPAMLLTLLSHTNADGQTPLLCACALGAGSLVAALLLVSPQPKATGTSLSLNGLQQAARYGHVDTFFTMMTAGCEADAPGGSMQARPIHLACQFGSLTMVDELRSQGLPLTVTDAHGQCPLHYAAMSGSVRVAMYLLQLGARATASDHLGRTAAHLAALHSQGLFLEVLFSQGRDLHLQRNNEGETPLDCWQKRHGYPLHIALQPGRSLFPSAHTANQMGQRRRHSHHLPPHAMRERRGSGMRHTRGRMGRRGGLSRGGAQEEHIFPSMYALEEIEMEDFRPHHRHLRRRMEEDPSSGHPSQARAHARHSNADDTKSVCSSSACSPGWWLAFSHGYSTYLYATDGHWLPLNPWWTMFVFPLTLPLAMIRSMGGCLRARWEMNEEGWGHYIQAEWDGQEPSLHPTLNLQGIEQPDSDENDNHNNNDTDADDDNDTDDDNDDTDTDNDNDDMLYSRGSDIQRE